MKIYLLFFLVAISNISYSQNYVWAHNIAGKGTSSPANLNPGASTCTGITTDKNENVLITGSLTDSADFDPGPAQYYLVSGGEENFYIAKYNPTGNLIWAYCFAAPGPNISTDIAIDSENNIIITGGISSWTDFDPSNSSHMVSQFAGTFFIAKFSGDGEYLWVQNFGDRGMGPVEIAVDKDDNLYLTGSFSDSTDFDPGPGITKLYSYPAGVFISCLNKNGQFLWAKNFDTGWLGSASSIAIDQNKNITVAGFFGETTDFDPGISVSSVTSITTSDRFISSYDSIGNFRWVKTFSTNEDIVFFVSRSIKITSDDDNNIIVTGNFSDTMNFCNDTTLISYYGHYSSYFGKLDDSGNILWCKEIYGTSISNGVMTDCAQNIFLCGSLGMGDFDPGPNVVQLVSTAPSASMNFFAKYDRDGNYNWVKAIGNGGYGGSTSYPVMHIDQTNQYIGGYFRQTGDFDPSPDSALLTMSGVGWNAFFGKYVADNIVEFGTDELVLCNNDSVKLTATMDNAHYLWQNNSTDSFLYATEEGLYYVVATYENCRYTDSIHIRICDSTSLTMPNVFTPDGDQFNDLFLPINTFNIRSCNLKIFNRWGKLVHETDDLEKD